MRFKKTEYRKYSIFNFQSSMKKCRVYLFSLVILVILAGCGAKGLTEAPQPDVVDESRLPHKVAIMPFVNQTSNPEAAVIVRKMFYNFFSSLNYLDLEPAFVDQKLEKKNFYSKITAGSAVSARKLGQLLGVDAVVFGEVLSLGKIYAVLYSDTEASLRARMVSCQSGQIIWELEHTAHLRSGEVPLSITGLAAAIVKTAISHQRADIMQAASKLAMQMVATVPDRPTLAESPPRIEVMVHNGIGKLLLPDSHLKVVLVGDKGLDASWSVPPLIENLPMKENEPGVYFASYRVKQQDRLPYGRLVGYLRSNNELQSQWEDVLGPITIGEPTVLPSIVSRDLVLSSAQSPYLIKEALVVLPGAKLTVNPGTVIWLYRVGIVVKGELNIRGTADAPVRMAGMGESGWKGILLDQSRADNIVSYLTLSNAEFGFKAAGSNVKFNHCLFQDNKWGIVLEETTAEIHDSLIRTSEKTGISARGSQLLVKGSTISENDFGGFLLENSPARLEQNNISNNGHWAIKVVGGKEPVRAAGNWWGTEDLNQEEMFFGPVEIQPVLKKPVAIQLVE
jgi:hypothetical protein